MLEIYFDGVLLDPINYMELTQKWVMFDKEFKLGMTPSREFNLTVPKSVFNENIENVKIVYQNNDYAYLILDKVSYDENNSIPKAKLTLMDKMVKANFNYDASELMPCTIRDILEDICLKMGVELGNEHFDNEDLEVDYWDNTVQAREYLSYISELAGGFARIENDGKLWIRKFDNSNSNTIDANMCEKIIIGQKHEVERVVFDNGLVKFEDFIRDNYAPPITDEQWVLSNGATLENGVISLPNMNSTASITIKWDKRKNSFGIGFMLVNGGNAHFSTDYLDRDGTRLSGNGRAILNKPDNYWHKEGFGGNNQYGEAISKAVYIRLVFQRSNSFAPKPYTFKDVVISPITPNEYIPYIYDTTSLETVYINPSNVYCNTQEEFDLMAKNILGFKYYNIDTGKTYILNNTMCGDVLKLSYQGQDYFTIQNTPDLKYLGVWQGKYTFNVESQQQAETKVSGLNTQVKAIRIKQNRDENILSLAVEDIKTQKNVINNQLFNQINANTTLIQQTANEITQSVNEITGQLSNDISGVASDLTDATNSLTGLIQQNTTLIQQLATSIISTIRTTGGNNLIRNSVGYSETDFWEVSGAGVVSTRQDDSMSLSGSEFILTGDVVLAQSYNTQAGVSYSISGKIKHTAMGTPDTIKIEILGQGGNIIEVLNTSEEFSEWHEFSLEEPYIATIQNPTLRITCTNNDVLEITDLIITLGENQSWSGYFDEVYGKEHKLDKNGLRLSNLASSNASKTTSTGIEILQNEQVVAEVSKNRVLSDNCVIKNSSSIGELQTVVLDANNIIEYV